MRCTNQKTAQKSFNSFAIMLGVSKDQDNNMQNHAVAKEQYGFNKMKTLGAVAFPKG